MSEPGWTPHIGLNGLNVVANIIIIAFARDRNPAVHFVASDFIVSDHTTLTHV
jgi:hypothetical protein